MPYFDTFKGFLYRTILKAPGEQEEGDRPTDQVALRHNAVDFLYHGLGLFTHFYGTALTIIFFLNAARDYPIFVKVLQAFSEPYLGALGMYVILKEVRKRYRKEESRHYGEFFVGLWVLLFVFSTLTTLLSPAYVFDEVYKLIITNSLATLVIYIGGIIHRP